MLQIGLLIVIAYFVLMAIFASWAELETACSLHAAQSGGHERGTGLAEDVRASADAISRCPGNPRHANADRIDAGFTSHLLPVYYMFTARLLLENNRPRKTGG